MSRSFLCKDKHLYGKGILKLLRVLYYSTQPSAMGKVFIQILFILAAIHGGNGWKLAVMKWSSGQRALAKRWAELEKRDQLEMSLNGQKLLVETDVIYPFTQVYRTNGKLIISGFKGKIWSLLEEKLNFTSVFRLLDRDFEINESNVTLFLANAYPSSFNFKRVTVPSTVIWFHLYTKHAPLAGDLLFYKSLSEFYLRDALLFMCVAFSILDWIIKKTTRRMTSVQKRKEQVVSFSESIINSLGLLCNQGTHTHVVHTSSRLFSLTQMVFTVIVSTAFSATLISKLAGASYLKLDVLSNLVSSGDYTLCSSEVGLVSSFINMLRFQSIPNFPKEWIKNVNRPPCSSNKLEYVPTSDYCLDNTVILEVFQVSNARWKLHPKRCNIQRHPTKLFKTLLSFSVAEEFRYLEVLNLHLLKFKEYGIINRLEREWLPKEHTIYAEDDIGLSFEEIQSFIELLCGGIVLALVAFILEVIIHWVFDESSRTVVLKKLENVKRPYVFVH